MGYQLASGMVNNAETARKADRFNSSCFSYSCFTEFGFSFVVQVDFNGPTNLSNPKKATGSSFKKNQIGTYSEINRFYLLWSMADGANCDNLDTIKYVSMFIS